MATAFPVASSHLQAAGGLDRTPIDMQGGIQYLHAPEVHTVDIFSPGRSFVGSDQPLYDLHPAGHLDLLSGTHTLYKASQTLRLHATHCPSPVQGGLQLSPPDIFNSKGSQAPWPSDILGFQVRQPPDIFDHEESHEHRHPGTLNDGESQERQAQSLRDRPADDLEPHLPVRE
jgi:hypothetical protein